jgi:hypothetical protein
MDGFFCESTTVTTSALARGRGGGGKLLNCGEGLVLLAFEFFLWTFLIFRGEMRVVEIASPVTGLEVLIRAALEFSRSSGSCIVDIGVAGPRFTDPDVVVDRRFT